jgi:hypothetical protein
LADERISPVIRHFPEVIMSTFKLDGAKFKTIEELKESLWPLYQEKMTREEFDRYVEENTIAGE